VTWRHSPLIAALSKLTVTRRAPSSDTPVEGDASSPLPSPPPQTVAERAIDPFKVVVLERIADLLPHRDAWARLAASAAEGNVFYEPWVLLPALEAFGAHARLAIVLVTGETGELLGFFPLEKRRALRVPSLRLWVHDYCYVPIPLVDRARGPEVMTAFFDWLAQQRRVLEIDDLPVDGAFADLLRAEIARRGWFGFVRDRFTRGLLAPDCDAETYQARAMAAKHRKEMRRRRKRLGELGTLTFDELGDGDLETWLREFLELEASGWKGREGTALGSHPADARFFQEMARASHRAGCLGATAIRLDGRPVAMQVMLRSGSLAYGFKIAYDESYSRYSPGVLLALDLIERVAGGSSLREVDSSAVRDHAMVNGLWTERRNVESLLIAGEGLSGLLVSLLPAVRFVRRAISRRRAS
jgi:CelD/BcsL family acetyltransferase involved in cellulose biosynthesis